MSRNTNIRLAVIVVVAIAGAASCLQNDKTNSKKSIVTAVTKASGKRQWIVPDTNELANTDEAKLIKYGRALIVNTSYYLGPKGVIAHNSNGMNCQNCHLDAGTKSFGNNFSKTSTGYPRFKERSGTVETIVKKVEDCFERSLNGKTIDSNGREMKAFVAYLTWIGKNVKKGTAPVGSGIEELPFLARAGDTVKGRMVYAAKCQVCHGKNGQGVLNPIGTAYVFPPLWGKHSYNIGASIYRTSKFAGYIKRNMPFKSDKNNQLTDEQAWDVAAFVNSQPHPFKNISADWPKLSTKPYDYPFGPYADHLFTASQHKYGPYAPIKSYYASLSKKK
ncbi:MAG: c-type cytochrome [Mucilaginibacter sp.]|nr:c-type cytochrome [Mucilaginibacter sp.]